MAFKSFRIPVSYAEAFEAELNTFLRTHRVLNVERQFVSCGEQSFWAFSIDYLESPGPQTAVAPSGNRAKVDYRDILKPDEFALFARLRDLRKEIAQVVQKQVRTKAELEKIDGIGEARVAKYGDRLLEFLGQNGRV